MRKIIMSKCVLIFTAGMIVSLTAMAFFAPMMQMGQQMMQMPQQFVCPKCSCEKAE